MQEIKINNDSIRVQSIDKENVIWKWITRFGGLLGIIITAIALFQILFTEPSVSVQLVSFTRDAKKNLVYPNYLSKDSTKFIGIKYLMKISINVSDEDLNYQDIIVELEYENGTVLKGQHFYPNRHFNDWNFRGDKFKLKIPQEGLFRYQAALEKNKTHLGYLSFLTIDSANIIKDTRPKKIRFTFLGSKNNFFSKEPKKIIVNELVWKQNKQMETIYEPEIWSSNKDKKEVIRSEFRKGTFPNVINRYVPVSDTAQFYNYLEGFNLYLYEKLKETEHNNK